jgi:putative PIG3 family NAD(P)H quinone oxidoreductase
MPVASEQGEPFSDNMGWSMRIANPPSEIRVELRCGSSAPLPEQRIGGGAVGGGLVPVGPDSRDLRFEPRNPFVELVLRIGAKVLESEATRRISAGPGTIGFFHCIAASAPSGLLSIGETVIRGKRLVNLTRAGGNLVMVASAGVELPETMQAIGFDAPGGPEVLRLQTDSLPRLRPDDVLIRVAYAGVNRPDCLQRAGLYPPPPGASPLLGLEVAGEVVAVGSEVPREMIGQHVAALTPGGGYAEYCAAHWQHCLPVPEGMMLAEAAALPETLFTVWHNLFERGLARDGERVLIHGGTSGIGTMAIMLAKAFGLEVIVTCGDTAKCAAATRIGADLAINYRDTDFVEAVMAHTERKGVHVVLDMVSGDYVARNLKCLAEDGRHVTIAVLGGAKADVNMAQVMMRRLTLTGSTLRPRSDTFKAALADEIADNAWPLFADGELSPVMDMTFPLAEAAAAHARMEAGDHIGKIVLEVRGG